MARGVPNYYQVLQVDPKAEPEVIRAAYLRLARKHHPDINRDPAAGERMKEINTAYDVLRDPVRRTEYDRSISVGVGAETVEQPHVGGGMEGADSEAEWLYYRCEVCGAEDSTVRLSAFIWVFSIVIFSWRRGAVGIWCSGHRRTEAAKWTMVSLLFGPWGVPWGLLWTLQALLTNIGGGHQPSEANAALLRGVGVRLLDSGNFRDASVALASSLEFENDAPTAQLLGSVIYQHPETAHAAGKVKGKLWAVSPVFLAGTVAVAATAIAVVVFLVSASTGGGEDDGTGEVRPVAGSTQAVPLGEESRPATGSVDDAEGVEVVCGGGTITMFPWEREKDDVLDYYNFVADRNEAMLEASIRYDGETASIITYDQAAASPTFMAASDEYLATLEREIQAMGSRSVPGRAEAFYNAVRQYWEVQWAIAKKFRDGAAFRSVEVWNEGVNLQAGFTAVDEAFDRGVQGICDYLGS